MIEEIEDNASLEELKIVIQQDMRRQAKHLRNQIKAGLCPFKLCKEQGSCNKIKQGCPASSKNRGFWANPKHWKGK